MMPSAGVWMLLAVAVLMPATGLPAWVVLIGVAGGAGIAGLLGGAFEPAILTALPSRLIGMFDSDLLQALPLYVLMGVLLDRLPLADTVLRVGARTLRRSGSGLPLAGLGLGVLLAPMNGSVGAGVAMLGRILLPRLSRSGLSLERASALVCVTGTLGVVIPPSLVLILLGDAMMRAHTEAVNVTRSAARIVNTQDIFRGALVPAALLLLAFALVAWWTARLEPARPPALEPVTRSDRFVAGTIVLVVIGLFAAVTSGRAYAVEAAATGGFALAVYAVSRRDTSWPMLEQVFAETMAVTGSLFALLVGANSFTLVARAFGTDRWVSDVLTGAGGSGPMAVVLPVMLVLGLCAFVLDAIEMIFVVVPIVIPPLLVRVPDVTWVAVLTLLILQTSFLLPPFGQAVLMLRSRLTQPLRSSRYPRAQFPNLVAQIGVIALVLAWPDMLWRDRSTLDGGGSGAAGVPVDVQNEMLRRQLDQLDVPEPGKDR